MYGTPLLTFYLVGSDYAKLRFLLRKIYITYIWFLYTRCEKIVNARSILRKQIALGWHATKQGRAFITN